MFAMVFNTSKTMNEGIDMVAEPRKIPQNDGGIIRMRLSFGDSSNGERPISFRSQFNQ